MDLRSSSAPSSARRAPSRPCSAAPLPEFLRLRRRHAGIGAGLTSRRPLAGHRRRGHRPAEVGRRARHQPADDPAHVPAQAPSRKAWASIPARSRAWRSRPSRCRSMRCACRVGRAALVGNSIDVALTDDTAAHRPGRLRGERAHRRSGRLARRQRRLHRRPRRGHRQRRRHLRQRQLAARGPRPDARDDERPSGR